MMVTLDDSELTNEIYSPICTYCRHANVDNARVCAAFPNGIPLEIWNGDNPHTSPYPGDHGIRFEPVSISERIPA